MLLASPWQRFDVLFQLDSINIYSSVPNYCCAHRYTHTRKSNLYIHTLHSTYCLTPPHTLIFLLTELSHTETD